MKTATNNNVVEAIERLSLAAVPGRADLEYLLALKDADEIDTLFGYADDVRKHFVGDEILLRGIVEFSNYCRRNCFYCGLRKDNSNLERFRLTADQVIDAVKEIVSCGIKTVVLQSGEDEELDPLWLKKLIENIKTDFNIAVTLSVGERSKHDYKLWRSAGADRYLLKIETSDESLYKSFHPRMSYSNRVRCLHDLNALGYQTGSGCMVGLRGQTLATLAGDICFFVEHNLDMIGIGPFIPNPHTPSGLQAPGDILLTLKVLALTRIVTKNTHLPATSAILCTDAEKVTKQALSAGANVIMPNFTPAPYKNLYEIYPSLTRREGCYSDTINLIKKVAARLNRTIGYTRGDSFKKIDSNCTIGK